MGFFGGSTTYVAAVVYNLAGDELKRQNYLKSIVVGGVLTGTQFSMGETIPSAYKNGPAIKARSFHRWAMDNYTAIGVPPLTLQTSSGIDAATMLPFIPVVEGEFNEIVTIIKDLGDITYWAERHILANAIAQISTAWTVAWSGTGDATITFPDATTLVFTPGSPAAVMTDQYFYVKYNRKLTLDSTLVRADIWIYKVGSGNATLDATSTSTTVQDSHFFPYIPLRYANVAIGLSNYPVAYELSKIAYKKAVNGKYDELLAKIEANPNIADIDRAYLIFATPLNTKDKSARRYIFEFFDYMYNVGGLSSVQILSPVETPLRLDITISWSALAKETAIGQGRLDAVVGDVWLTSSQLDGGEKVFIWFQRTSNLYDKITVFDPLSDNEIHNDKSVRIKGEDALVDPDESGFVIPIHYGIFRSMTMVHQTQIMTCSILILFNCQETVKQKWYQTDAFKVFIFIVIVVISVVFPPAGAIGTAAYASIGAAIGLTGLAAVIAGAVISQLAAMILMKVVGAVSTEIFGEKFGAIIAAVVAVVLVVVGPQLMSGQSISASWGSLSSAANLIKLTNALGDGIAGYIQASAMETMAKAQDVQDDYVEKSADIAALYEQNIGYDNGMIDPTILTNFLAESQDSFLARTLLTGSDIAELSMDMVTNFANYTISTRL